MLRRTSSSLSVRVLSSDNDLSISIICNINVSNKIRRIHSDEGQFFNLLIEKKMRLTCIWI